jgi:modification methylase
MNRWSSRHRDCLNHPPILTSVWPTGTQGLDAQLTDRDYHPATHTIPPPMAPAIAEYAITTLTQRGDIVLDPNCGTGTTIVEALRAGRHAIGLTTHRRWHVARSNVTAIKARGALCDGMVLLRRSSTVAAAQTTGLTGRVGLLLTSADTRVDQTTALLRLRTLLHECRPLLRPGGHVVITCAPQRHPTRHDLVDLPGLILTLAAAVGLAPIARCLVLTAKVSGARVLTRAQRRIATRIERAAGHPIALSAHHTALVFRADPDTAAPAGAHPIPPHSTPPRRHRARMHPAVVADPSENPPLSVEAGCAA